MFNRRARNEEHSGPPPFGLGKANGRHAIARGTSRSPLGLELLHGEGKQATKSIHQILAILALRPWSLVFLF
ncbi:hypothetical protein LIER_16148 [Lithospermum erythrorhizon]|uniref:Uncharacterized protein n=1 Tax=Lithospermum erythrorhizon TaxID=34254 RepID=A0AAV3Q5H6_LITER